MGLLAWDYDRGIALRPGVNRSRHQHDGLIAIGQQVRDHLIEWPLREEERARSPETLERELGSEVSNWLRALDPALANGTPTELFRREASLLHSVEEAIRRDPRRYDDPYLADVWAVREASLAHPSVEIEPIVGEAPRRLWIRVRLDLTATQLDAIDRLKASQVFETPVWIRAIYLSGQERVFDRKQKVEVGVRRPERIWIPMPEDEQSGPWSVFIKAQYHRGTFYAQPVEV